MISQFKILLAVAALLILAVAVLGAAYMYRKVFQPAYDMDRQAQALLESNLPGPDLGQKAHAEAMECVSQGDFAGALEKLQTVLDIYPESSAVTEARRVIGEINLDRIFSKSPAPGKLEYLVKRGDSLAGIASRNRTTIRYIEEVNGLLSTTIHPGDRLVLYPLDVEFTVDLKNKSLSVWEHGRFLKEYGIIRFKRQPGRSFPGRTRIEETTAWVGGQPVLPTDSRAFRAEIWLQTPRRAQSPGVVIGPEPGEGGDAPPEEHIACGVFLDRADMLELAMLTLAGTPVNIVD